MFASFHWLADSLSGTTVEAGLPADTFGFVFDAGSRRYNTRYPYRLFDGKRGLLRKWLAGAALPCLAPVVVARAGATVNSGVAQG